MIKTSERHFLLVLLFVVFEVAVALLCLWAILFRSAVAIPGTGAILMIEMTVFLVLVGTAFLYAWGRGVFVNRR